MTTASTVQRGLSGRTQAKEAARAGEDAEEEVVELELTSTSASLYSLWQAGHLCDVTLETGEGATLPAHRIVLAAASGYFAALFTGAGAQMQEGRGGGGGCRVALPALAAAPLRALLEGVYSARLALRPHTVQPLLAAADYLEVAPAKAACARWLQRHLSLGSAAAALATANVYGCDELLAAARRYLEGHFSELLRSPEAASLQQLPVPLLADLLASDALGVGGELDTAQAALLWAAADPRSRAAALPSLLAAVRLPPQELAQRLVQSSGGGGGQGGGSTLGTLWQQLDSGAAEALLSAALQACEQLHSSSGSSSSGGGGRCGVGSSGEGGGPWCFSPRQSCPTGLMVAGGLDEGWRPLRTVEVYDPHGDRWRAGPAMPAPCSFAAAAMVGNSTLVVEGTAHAPHVLAFDRHEQRWAHRPGLLTPRVNMAVAPLDGCLYVLGGRAGIGKGAMALQDVEVYCPSRGESASWRQAAPMSSHRTSHGAAALGGMLYAVGGQSDRATHASAEAYDPESDRWLPLGAALQQSRKYLGVGTAAGRVFAVGGMTSARLRLASVEALDPREGVWHALPPMTNARSSCAVAALHDELYVLGGNAGSGVNENFEGVECWCAAAGRWRPCAPLSQGRSGLAAAPI